jgi:hypothetical protein
MICIPSNDIWIFKPLARRYFVNSNKVQVAGDAAKGTRIIVISSAVEFH